MHSIRHRFAALAQGLALAIAAASAQAHLEETKVYGRQVNLIGEAVSASEGLVSQQELSLRPLLRAGEIIESVPGMIATQHSGTGKANQYFLRGFNLDHGTDFATWYDDMPVNMRSHGHGQGYTDLNFIIPELVEQIAYRKGAYYADVGDFSGAGAAFISSADRFERGTLSATVGEDDYYRLLAMDSVALGAGDFLYAIEGTRYRGPWSDISEDLDKLNVVLKQSWQNDSGRWQLTVMGYDNSWNAADQIPLRAVDSGLIDELGSLDRDAGGESSRYSLSLGWASGGWDAHAYAIRYRLNLWSNFTYFLDDPVNGDQFEQQDQRWIYGGQTQYRWSGEFAGKRLDNRVGIEVRRDDIGDVGLYRTAARQRIDTVRRDAIDETSAALFAESTQHWSTHFRTVFGLRYDHYDFDVRDRAGINGYGVDLAANAGRASDDLVSPKFSAIYQLNEQWEVYLSAGRGFHSNDARGTTAAVDPISGDALDRVDALVRSRGEEVGLRWFLGDRINASLALWQLELDSELLYVGDAGTTEATRPSERRGVELTTYYRVSDVWTLDFEYAWTDTEFSDRVDGEGNRIDGALRQAASAGISAQFGSGWFGSLRARYFGPRDLDSFGDVKSKSTTVFNLRAGVDLGNLELTADLLNAFDSDDHDVDYYYASQLQGEPAPVDDIHFHVMEPRTLRLSATWHY
jgi:outer membrane receptor protein involved in Fe transport